MENKISSPRTYIIVYLALLLFLATTIAAAYINLGIWNLVIAITIAIAKATLVILFFMHVRQSGNLTRIFVLMGLVWLAILVSLTLTDYLTRFTGF
jgi:cytochrome c oxidase subunit 4